MVKDSAGMAIADVSVSLISEKTKVGFAFSRTDEKGHFELRIDSALLIADSFKVQIKISGIGYSTLLCAIPEKSPNIYYLKRSNDYLEPVVVRSGNDYISKKQDTISYNAEKFIEKEDRVLKDLLKHLPGIEVSDDGNVKFNGNPINKLYIEGHDMLAEKYNLATKNINATAVEKVQVIEHNQPIKMLKGIVPSDQAGINIKLKNKNKFRNNFKVELEGGTPSKYKADINNFSYKNKFLGLNFLKLNNTGLSYTDEAVSSSSADFEFFQDNNFPFGLVMPPGFYAPIKQNRYWFNKTALLNLNEFFVLPKDYTFRFNGWIQKEEVELFNDNNTNYQVPNNQSISYFENARTNSKTQNFAIQLSLNNNSEKKYFNNSLNIESMNQNFGSGILTNQGNFTQKLKSPYFKLSNSFSQIYQLGKGNNIQYNNYISYYRQPQTLEFNPSKDFPKDHSQNEYKRVVQKSKIPTFFIDNNIKYFIDRKIFQYYIELGGNYQNQVLSSEIGLLQNNDSIKYPKHFENYLQWKKTRVYNNYELTFKKDNNRISLALPFNLTMIQYKDTISNQTKKLDKILFSPNFRFTKKIGKEHELVNQLYYSNRIGTINSVFPNPVFSDYRTFYANDIPLFLGSLVTLNSTFYFKKTLKLFFGNIGVRASKSFNHYISSQTIDSLSTKNTAIPKENTNNSWGITTYLSKYFFPLKTAVSINFQGNFTSLPQLQNGKEFITNNQTISTSLSFSPKIFSWLKLDVKGTYTKNKLGSKSSGFIPQNSITLNENTSITIYPNESSILQLSNEYFSYLSNGKVISNSMFLDGYYQQTIKNKYDLRFSVSNITNQRRFTSISQNNNSISINSFLLTPRMFLLSAYFNL